MTEIKIKDLRGVGDVELNLDDTKRVFVFFGSNGVGKTKTLEALLLLSLKQTKEFDFFPDDYELSKQAIIGLRKPFRAIQLNNIEHLLKDIDDIPHIIDYRSFFKLKIVTTFQALAFLGAKARTHLTESKMYNSYSNSLGSFEERKRKFMGLISYSIASNELTSLGMSQDINQWFIERATSVNPYQKEEDNRKVDIDTVLNALHILDNRIEKTLKIDGDGNVFLTIAGQERELSELSSGFISVVKIIQSIISAYSAFTNATDLLNVKGVVLIDEIESHLHIEWQTKIVPTLKNLFPNTTFYIATHSPLVLSQLAEGEAYLLKRDADGVVRSQEINSPNTRLLANVLQDTFGVDLNTLKRANMANIDQSQAKQRLLDLLNSEAQP